jgi:hypothetical protein
MLFLPECEDLLYVLYLLNSPTNESQKSLFVLETGSPENWQRTSLRHFPAERIWHRITLNNRLLNSVPDSHSTGLLTEKCVPDADKSE